jgi:hypothetical protein
LPGGRVSFIIVLLMFSWRRSSAEEQGTHKPLVTGSNPVAAI